jgi:photosystem II stability/assembly factor-like uncharacterized protein
MFTPPKRLLAITLFAALAVVQVGVLRAQWVQTNGPNGGVSGLIVVSGTCLYARGANSVDLGAPGHVFLSTDTGTSWEPFSLSGKIVQSIAGCGSFLLAGTDYSFYISKNYGATWSETFGLSSLDATYGLYLVQSGSNIIAAGNGVFRSTDSGNHWVEAYSIVPLITGLASIGSNIFVSSIEGVFHSSDDGTTWNIPKDTIDMYALAVMGRVLFASTEDYEVLRSTDSGVSWTNTGIYAYVPDLFVEGTNIYAAGSYISKDTGNSWIPIHLGNSEATSIAALGKTIFVGTFGGLFRSTDSGMNGELVGLPSLNTGSLFASGNNLFESSYAYFSSANISTDEGLTWNPIGNGQIYPAMLVGSTIVAENDYGIAISTDNGVSWIQSNLPSTLGYPNLVRMGKYLFASTERFAIGETDTDVFRSPDEGRTWSVICTEVQPQVYGWLIPLSGNRLLYGGSSDDTHFAAYLSDDFGESWQYVDSTTLTSSNTSYIPFGLCCHPPTPVTQIGTITFGLDSGVLYRSSDDGSSWELVDSGLMNDSLSGINSAAATGSNLFICAKSGNIFLSTDTGSTWKNINDGLIDGSISFLAVTGQYLFAANTNDSFWRRPLGDFGIAAVAPVVEIRNSLQSYPNPFTQSTQITFTSPDAGYADISIVNLLGEQVAHVFSGELDADTHNFTFANTAGLPDGIYECMIRMNGRVGTLPLVLIH